MVDQEETGQPGEEFPADTASIAVAERMLEALRAVRPWRQSVSAYRDGLDRHRNRAPAHCGGLLRDADVALYEAKAAGKQRYTVFQPEMRWAVESHVELQKDLGRAVERDEFLLVYQPIFEIEMSAVVGVEALLRWQHPVRGLVMPNEFIPILEENGLIITVGRQVLIRACQQPPRGARPAMTCRCQ